MAPNNGRGGDNLDALSPMNNRGDFVDVESFDALVDGDILPDVGVNVVSGARNLAKGLWLATESLSVWALAADKGDEPAEPGKRDPVKIFLLFLSFVDFGMSGAG